MNNPQTIRAREVPLGRAAKVGLFVSAIGLIALFYVFVTLSVTALFFFLLIEFGLVLALARFGLASIMTRAMREHGAPLPIFLKSLRLKKGVEYRIWLRQEDAPALFAMLRDLGEGLQVRPPQAVALEMTAGAWVKMEGLVRGAGKSMLGVGYDLLAGLNRSQLEAVMAHEMTHAKLVQRGVNRILRGGLNRAIQLVQGLSAQVENARRVGKTASLTNAFLPTADAFARRCAKIVAACSRQDEFAADLGATEVCRPGALQSALVRIDEVERNANRLPWRERVARLQTGTGFSDWLQSELNSNEKRAASEIQDEVHDRYATHPTLKERLAALPQPHSLDPDVPHGGCGLGLLAQPDVMAEKLIAEIQRVVAEQEQKDSKELERWNRRIRSRSQLRTLQSFGIVAAGCGVIIGAIIWFTVGLSTGMLKFVALTVVPGLACYRFGGYRVRSPLPIPDFSVFKAAWRNPAKFEEATLKNLEQELRDSLNGDNRRARARSLSQEAYSALARCDYIRAHTAAKLALEQSGKSFEAEFALGICASAFGQLPRVQSSLRAVQKTTRFLGGSAAWGAAWMYILCGDWEKGEALMFEARRGRGGEPTLLALLAMCQARRGKLQSAILNARRACEPEPRNKEYSKLLISFLLDAGYLREARERLNALQSEWQSDGEIAFSILRLKLLCREFAEAEEWETIYRKFSSRPYDLLRLGAVFEGARKPEKASRLYYESLGSAYFPEAFIGLARISSERRDRIEAERHLLSALNLDKTVGESGARPLQVAPQVFQRLRMLEEPILNCRTWIAALTGSGFKPPLSQQSLFVHAPDQAMAFQFLTRILSAMRPGSPPILPNAIIWRAAPREQQPDGPVRPGVLGFL